MPIRNGNATASTSSGVSKANSSVDYAMLEYCIREDLKLKRPRLMAVLDPIKLVIDNYPEGEGSLSEKSLIGSQVLILDMYKLIFATGYFPNLVHDAALGEYEFLLFLPL